MGSAYEINEINLHLNLKQFKLYNRNDGGSKYYATWWIYSLIGPFVCNASEKSSFQAEVNLGMGISH